MDNYLYLFIDIGCILIPFIASFYSKHAFYKEWKFYLPATLIVGFLFLIWDAYFTKIGVWGFNPHYLSGIYIYNLPIEEILFFFCIPYACVFTYFAFEHLIKTKPFESIHRYISITLLIVLGSIGVIFFERAYTSTTFILSSMFLLIVLLKKINMSRIYVTFLSILPFFFISNGILTGTGLMNPIVWYNNEENLGIRILSIPVEDSIYGFLLIALNILLYLFFKKLYGKKEIRSYL